MSLLPLPTGTLQSPGTSCGSKTLHLLSDLHYFAFTIPPAWNALLTCLWKLNYFKVQIEGYCLHIENKLTVTKGESRGRDKLRVWD